MSATELDFVLPADRQATRPAEERGLARDGVRLLVTTRSEHRHAVFGELPRFLPAGALLVVNRSATLAASLPAEGGPGYFLLNLSTRYADDLWLAEPRWSAGEPGPLPLEPGAPIRVAGEPARLVAPYPATSRLWYVRFEGSVEQAMARAGAPIRYGYLRPPHPGLDAYQTLFGDTPGSAEMPSAARPFTSRTVEAVRAAGIRIARIVLHSGVSSLDRTDVAAGEVPLLPEPFRVPWVTAAAINRARCESRPVIAVGTTVVRALESAWDGREVRRAAGFTRRFVHPGRPVRAVDGLLTGFHDPDATHLAMLGAIADPEVLGSAYREALESGYLWHEFGDMHLILR